MSSIASTAAPSKLTALAPRAERRRLHRARSRAAVRLAPGARLIGGSVVTYAEEYRALVAQYGTHRRDAADPTQLHRVRMSRGRTRSAARPVFARFLTALPDLLQQRSTWALRQLARHIDVDHSVLHRIVVQAESEGWLVPRWCGDDAGAEYEMRGSHWTLRIPPWIPQDAIEAARPRGGGAVPTVDFRATAPVSHATIAVASISNPSEAALAIHRQLPRLDAHAAFTRVRRRHRATALRGLGHTELLVMQLVVRKTVESGAERLSVGQIGSRCGLSRGQIRKALASLATHGVVRRLARTTWSISPTDIFAVLDDVAGRLGLHRVRQLRELEHQREQHQYWERCILHGRDSNRMRDQIRRMGYEVPAHLVSLRSYEEQVDKRCRNEVFVLASARPAPRRPTRQQVLGRPQTVEIDGRPCLLDLVQLQQRLDMLVVEGLPSGVATTMITEEIEQLAREQGLSVRREVRVPVPRLVGRRDGRPRWQRVDLVIEAPGRRPLYVEIDRAEKRESRRKLTWAVSQGADAIWVRWGGSRDVRFVGDGVRVVEPRWRRARRRVA